MADKSESFKFQIFLSILVISLHLALLNLSQAKKESIKISTFIVVVLLVFLALVDC